MATCPSEQGGADLRCSRETNKRESYALFGWAITLLVIALIAAILGFGGLAGTLVDIAIIIFVIALILGVVMLFLGYRAGRSVIR